MILMKLFKFIVISVLAVIGLASCSSKVPENYVACFLESPKQSGVFERQRYFTLPVLDREVRVGENPIFNIDAFSDCLVTEKYDEVLDRSIPGLFFRLKDEYAIRLKQIAAKAPGRKLLLVANGRPLGFSVLKTDYSRNDMFFFIMTSATGEEERDQLDDLCFELNGFILEYREYKENK